MTRLTIGWLYIVVLLGAVQGAVLAGALATKRRNRTANRLLATAMLAFSVGLTSTVYHAAQLEERFPHFFGVGYPLPFLYGPLVYLYAVAAADRNRLLHRGDFLHFGPFLAVVVWGLPIYMLGGPGKLALYQQMLAGELPLLVRVADPFKFVSGIGYAAATLLFLRRHRERVKGSYSSTERVNLRWLLWLGAAAAGIWTMATVFNVLEAMGVARVDRADDYVSLAVAILVYAIGYRGMRQPEIFRFETAEHPIPLAGAVAMTALASDPQAADASRYARSGLTEAEARRLKEKLQAVMDNDCPWKKSELTLADLAERLGTTPHKLSEVLNGQVGETFYDLVNGYRVREVQRRIAAGDTRSLTILSLALDAGFASKSTFNQAFKKHTNQTPTDYRQAAGA